MSPAQLLAHFNRVCEAPGAVPRLRRFILDLAVRGKLVEQDPGDEPAAELIRLIRGRGARQPDHLGLAPTGSFLIPDSWVWARLGEVGEWGSGSTPERGNQAFYGGGMKWFKSGELNDNPQLTGSEESITQSAMERCSFRRNKPGDVLIAMYGATIGKVAILAESAVTNQAVCGCTPIDELLNRYLFEFLKSQRAQFRASSEGGAQPNISKIKLLRFLIPVPPLREQYRIVAKVDELMALCDRLEAAQAERERRRDRLVAASLTRLNAPARAGEAPEHVRFHLNHLPRLTTRREHLKEMRQTILNLAVRGMLVAQEVIDEHAADADRSGGVSDAVPFEIPKTWRWSRLKALGHLKGGGTPSKSREDFWNGTIPWVSPKDMKRDYIDGAQMKITSRALEESAATMIEVGSLLFVVRGMILAHSFPVGISRVPLSVNQDMKVLTLHHPEFGEFLLRALKGLKEEMLRRVQRSSHGTCRIEGADYGNFPLPIPPLAEQQRIVAKVDELMAVCDKLEAELSASETESTRLLEATLHQALAVA